MKWMGIVLFFAFEAFLSFCVAYGQYDADSVRKRVYVAERTVRQPVVDGSLGDDCWMNDGVWSGGFVKQQPDEGDPESEETALKILYDDRNVYVAFRALDSEAAKINRWLAPRDMVRGDAVYIVFDSYRDGRTGFAFALTAAGGKADFVCWNSANDDYTWNAVWEGRVSVDSFGWYAEFSIPLSQLRYAAGEEEQTWGMHAVRVIDRKMETDHLHLVRRNNSGLVFSFGRMEGLRRLPARRRVELLPYASAAFRTQDAGGRSTDPGAGLDGKVGLSSDFTLDFTVNPDFGQVEADPSTINLSAYETYYEEKRPFFVEGKGIFSMPGETMFYSRRIGASLTGGGSEGGGGSSVISAVKVSGKNRKGLALGLLNALTGGGDRPFTSYSVARVQKDVDGGNTVVGGMLTAVNRSGQDRGPESLAGQAYAVGADFEQYFREREYYVRANVQGSYVAGSREAITALQRSPVHYFQREGARHVSVDSMRTALGGSAGSISVGRSGAGKLVFRQVFSWAGPGFDVNEAGYIEGSDYMLANGLVGYVDNAPRGWFRSYEVYAFSRYQWNFGGVNTLGQAGIESTMNFRNKWYLYLCGAYYPRVVESGLLRGGPLVRANPRWGTDVSMGSDQSERFWMKAYHGTATGAERYSRYAWLEANYRPAPNVGLSARLNYSYHNSSLEYVGQCDAGPMGKVYLMGALSQRTAGLTLRIDYSISPDVSIQFYGNPFISSGRYTGFKRATDTMNKDYERRFRPLAAGELSYEAEGNRYVASEAGGLAYGFDNPDFSFRECRFNLVARWEYRPNSILYLVWGQSRSDTAAEYIGSLGRNLSALLDCTPADVFMFKFSYLFNL
ncbi:MAG: carbohydrate binding family 9 domain-containing protein [Tannerellaceae bacterium]|jgi:hypothetical protein|nr:carbohydrate binding family 9 domain-containing protein [Tannerellaceae bacterium]